MTRARGKIDYRGIASGLFLGSLCTMFALSAFAHAVGAVVTPVGDWLGQDSRGIGMILGCLLAGAFFGLFGYVFLSGPLTDLRTARRGAADAGEARPALAARPTGTLRDGPGLAPRWSAAAALMLVAAFGPVLAAAVLRTWGDLAFDGLLRAVDGRPIPSFGAAFGEHLLGVWPLALLPLALTVGFLLRRDRMASWPTAAALNAVVVLGFGASASLSAVEDPVALKAALLLAIVGAGYWLGRLAEQVLTRPVATDVVRSGLEIAFRLPRRLPRLRVQEDGLVLDRLRRWGTGSSRSRTAISFAELTDVRVETRTSATRWSVSGPDAQVSRTIPVPAGPAVRVEAGKRTWLLPARSERVARLIVTAIALRAHG